MVNNKRLSLIVVVFALQVSEKYLKHKEYVGFFSTLIYT